MMLILVLSTAFISIGLLLVSVALKSRSVALLNVAICAVILIVTQPWSYLQRSPPADPEMRIYWQSTLLALLFLAISFLGFLFSLIPRGKKSSGKRRRRSRSSRSREPVSYDS